VRCAQLRATRDLSPDSRLFEIEPVGEFIAPTPGSHFNIAVQINGRPDVRNYSAVGPGTDGLYRIAVKSLPDSRGGSAYMWSLAPGAQLMISTPSISLSSAAVVRTICCSRAASALHRSSP
jgi:ferredoxin-NADP reductase